MKRFLLAILSILYLSAATGANLHLHYCMGELAGWNFGHQEEKVCGKCGMEKNGEEENTCCKDEFTNIKLKVDQKSNNTVAVDFNLQQQDHVITCTNYTDQLSAGLISAVFSNSQRFRSSSIPCYLTYCNFRI